MSIGRCDIAIYTLIVAKALRLADRPGELITRAEIEAEADRWANREPRPPQHAAGPPFAAPVHRPCHPMAHLPGTSATGGLAPGPTPNADQVAEFADYMLRERGLSPRTVEYRLPDDPRVPRTIDEAGLRLDALTVAQVDDPAGQEGPGRAATRASPIQTYASTLRAFFRYAEGRGLVPSRLGGGDHGPAGVPVREPPGRPVLGRREAAARRHARGPARRHPRSCPADAAGGLRPPLRGGRGPAPGGLRLGAGDADRPARQAAEAADLPAVPPGRRRRPPLLAGGAPPVGPARGVPHPPGTVPAVDRAAAWGRRSAGGCTPWA